jgi:hypothetical protein
MSRCGMASSVGFRLGISFAVRSFPRTAITKKHHYVNEASYSQDYSDDLAEAPGVLASFDVQAITMSLGPHEYAFLLLTMGTHARSTRGSQHHTPRILWDKGTFQTL